MQVVIMNEYEAYEYAKNGKQWYAQSSSCMTAHTRSSQPGHAAVQGVCTDTQRRYLRSLHIDSIKRVPCAHRLTYSMSMLNQHTTGDSVAG